MRRLPVPIFVGPWSNFSDLRPGEGLRHQARAVLQDRERGRQAITVTVGQTTVEGWDSAKWLATLKAAGYPAKADTAKVNWVMWS